MFTKNEDAYILRLFLQCNELIVTVHTANQWVA